MRLEEFRKKAKLTQAELGERIGVKDNTICQWETGARQPKADIIIRLADVLGCSADDLLGIDREKTVREED